MSTNRRIARGAVLCAATATSLLLAGGIASAHVTANVYGDTPEKGGYGAIVLRVPNEEEKVGTTEVEVTIPAEYGITSARTKPVPGWTAEVTETDDVVTRITWKAEDGHEIAAGTTSYEEFEIVLGALPEDVDTLVLPTSQTYSDGTVVKWDEPPADDSEPERPAPVVELAESSGHGHGHGTSSEQPAAAAETDDTARLLGGAGLVLGALGLGFGVGATLRARKAGRS
nr:YcnI family protein [Saccharomonospora glauca]